MFDYKLLGVLLAALTLACGAPPEPPVEVAEEVSEMPPADTAGAEIPEVAPTPPGSTRFEVGEGTRVYYRVREQLVGVSFLNDAVGVSNGISGAVVVGPDGKYRFESVSPDTRPVDVFQRPGSPGQLSPQTGVRGGGESRGGVCCAECLELAAAA